MAEEDMKENIAEENTEREQNLIELVHEWRDICVDRQGRINEQSEVIERQNTTINRLVRLCDELRRPYMNTTKHDLYVKATDLLNALDDQGWLE